MSFFSARNKRILFACFCAGAFWMSLALTSCQTEKKPSNLIPADKMEDLLYDYHCAQGMAESSGDSMEYRRYVYIHAVFQKYGVTETQFDSSMVWYSADAAQLEVMYRHIQERMEKETALYAALLDNQGINYSTLSLTGDTANIWHGRNFYFLRAGTLTNRMTFTIPADSTFQEGDSLLWQFKPMFIVQGSGGREAYSGIAVHYEDTTVSVQRRITSDEQVDLHLRPVPDREIKKIVGFVYYTTSLPSDEEKFRALVLQNIHLVRFHKQKANSLLNDSIHPADSLALDTIRSKASLDTLDRHQDSIGKESGITPRRQSSPADFRRRKQ